MGQGRVFKAHRDNLNLNEVYMENTIMLAVLQYSLHE